MQTAKAVIADANKNVKATVRILFNGCSQKSFITEEVSTSLNLRVIREERMIVRGFGGKNEMMRVLDVVTVKVMDISEKICGEIE